MKRRLLIISLLILTLFLFNTGLQAYNMEQQINYQLKRGSTLEDGFTKLEKITDDEIIFYFDDEVNLSQEFRMVARKKTYESVLNLILQLNNLSKTRLSEQLFHIYPESKKQEYEKRKEKTFVEKKYPLNFIESKDLIKKLQSQYRIDKYITGEHSLYLRYDSSQRASIEKAIKILDRQRLQTEIEITILEFKRNKAKKAGIEWANGDGRTFLDKILNLEDEATKKYFTYPKQLKFEDIRAYSEVISNPTIRAENKEESRIFIGESIPNITKTTSTKGNTTTQDVKVEYEDIGINLKITPHIRLNEEVTLDVDLKIDSLGEKEGSYEGINVYRKLSKEVETKITIANENSIVIGGLITNKSKNENRKIPLISEIPIIGNLFKFKSTAPEKSEIIMLITPKIIDIKDEVPTNIDFEKERMKNKFDVNDYLEKPDMIRKKDK